MSARRADSPADHTWGPLGPRDPGLALVFPPQPAHQGLSLLPRSHCCLSLCVCPPAPPCLHSSLCVSASLGLLSPNLSLYLFPRLCIFLHVSLHVSLTVCLSCLCPPLSLCPPSPKARLAPPRPAPQPASVPRGARCPPEPRLGPHRACVTATCEETSLPQTHRAFPAVWLGGAMGMDTEAQTQQRATCCRQNWQPELPSPACYPHSASCHSAARASLPGR